MSKPTRLFLFFAHHPLLLFILSAAVAYSVGLAMITSGDAVAIRSVDGIDRLGRGLQESGVLSFYPNRLETVLRGPVYPAVVAGAMVAGQTLYPFLLLLFHAIFHGLTVLCVVRLVRELSSGGSDGRSDDRSDRRAVIAGLIVAFHPLLLMYAGRAMIEPLSILLFTAAMLAAVRAARHGRAGDFASLGLLIGLAALTKGVFLVLLFLPLLVYLFRDRAVTVRRAGLKYASTLLLALLVIGPWTWRNHYVSGSIVPVQILDGVNVAVGDHLAEHWDASPLAYGPIVDGFPYPDFRGTSVDMMAVPAGVAVAYDREMRARALERYRAEPSFLLKKLALQSVTFWGLWSSLTATLFAGGMQVVLLLLFLWAGHRIRRDGGWRDRRLIPFWSVWLYVLPHLPLFAIGRYSVVLIPAMIAVIASSKRR